MTQEQSFRNKVNMTSVLLALLVVFFHSYAFMDGAQAHFAYHFQYFICQDLAQGAVPTFFALSGFLFYRNFHMDQLGRKLKSRFHSLVIPYLFWNTVYTLYFFLAAKMPFVSTQAFPLDAEHLIRGIFFHEYNGPFWYMFQLILLSALSPVLYTIMKHRGTAVVFLLGMYTLYGMNITSLWILQTRAVIYYSLGVFFALHYPEKIVSANRVHPIGIAAFVLSQLLIYSRFADTPLAYITARILLIVSYANFSNLFCRITLPKFLLCSFPVYAMHDIFVETLNKVFSFFVSPAGNAILLDFFLTTAITVGICIAINEITQRIAPGFHRVIFGGRAS